MKFAGTGGRFLSLEGLKRDSLFRGLSPPDQHGFATEFPDDWDELARLNLEINDPKGAER